VAQSISWDPGDGLASFPSRQLHNPVFSTHKVHWNYVDCVRWLGNYVMSKSVDNRIIIWQPEEELVGHARGHVHFIQARRPAWEGGARHRVLRVGQRLGGVLAGPGQVCSLPHSPSVRGFGPRQSKRLPWSAVRSCLWEQVGSGTRRLCPCAQGRDALMGMRRLVGGCLIAVLEVALMLHAGAASGGSGCLVCPLLDGLPLQGPGLRDADGARLCLRPKHALAAAQAQDAAAQQQRRIQDALLDTHHGESIRLLQEHERARASCILLRMDGWFIVSLRESQRRVWRCSVMVMWTSFQFGQMGLREMRGVDHVFGAEALRPCFPGRPRLWAPRSVLVQRPDVLTDDGR
jgi:hypothetical protein